MPYTARPLWSPIKGYAVSGYLWGYVMLRARNLTEKECCVLYEFSDMMILVSLNMDNIIIIVDVVIYITNVLWHILKIM
jgi:hypothetical protein